MYVCVCVCVCVCLCGVCMHACVCVCIELELLGAYVVDRDLEQLEHCNKAQLRNSIKVSSCAPSYSMYIVWLKLVIQVFIM